MLTISTQPFADSQAQLILVDVEPLRPWIPMLTWTNSFGAFTKRQVLHRGASFMPSFIFAGAGSRGGLVCFEGNMQKRMVFPSIPISRDHSVKRSFGLFHEGH